MRRFWTNLLAITGALAIVVGVNMFGDARLGAVQADLTQQKLYTLSRGTRTILAHLKDPITLRLYYSPRLGTAVPSYGTLADHVREMLREYVTASHGKIHVQVLNPEPFSDTEDQALSDGLQAVPLTASGEKVYFGLVGTNMLDDEKTIAFFQPERERFLEYDLTKLVYDLSNPSKPVVGLMSALPIEGDPRLMMMGMRSGSRAGAPWVVSQELHDAYTMKTVPTDAQVIDKSIQVLLVAQPQNLPDATLYAIDQFVMRGGRLMVMVDPYSEAEAASAAQTGMPSEDTGSNLPKLFDAWGITFDSKDVVGDLDNAWRVRATGSNASAVEYVPWFNIRGGIARDDPASADLTQVTVASAGVVGQKPGAPIAFTPLLTSGRESGLLPVEEVRDPDPAKVLADFHPQGGPRVIAARVRGVLHSAFTGPPPAPADKPRPADFPAHIAQTNGPANLVVVGDTDILADRFWVRVQDFFGQSEATPFSDNGAFVVNVIGTLAGGDALIGLRGRGDSIRPFTVVDRMQSDAEARFRQVEQTLQQHLEATEKTLKTLRQGGAGEGASGTVITPEQRDAIDKLRTDILTTRAQLRRVQFDLRRDVGALESELKIADIVAVPALLAVLAIALAFHRARRRAQARA